MTIDARQIERVRARIAQYMADETRCVMEKYIDAEDLAFTDKVLAAYAATLPREVRVETWGVLYGNGALSCVTYESEAEASMSASSAATAGSVAIRLTGTAVIKPEV